MLSVECWMLNVSHTFSLILLIALGTVLLPARSPAAGTWTPLVNQAPGGVGLMLLLSDGTVMCQNGST